MFAGPLSSTSPPDARAILSTPSVGGPHVLVRLPRRYGLRRLPIPLSVSSRGCARMTLRIRVATSNGFVGDQRVF
jgi:hypothetical protein